MNPIPQRVSPAHYRGADDAVAGGGGSGPLPDARPQRRLLPGGKGRVALELLAAWAIRDNLTLNVLMLIHPVDAIKAWQMVH